ncbi:uncharacterized protein [Nicotiana sylvestris]|uniref:uncharacterized protein n=1 Tax=Nicotiana sylvestris TaxID=4096 RepID=UPI00388CD136
MELVQMDIYGLMKILSRDGKKHVMVLVDDYSRFTWILFLASKDEAFDMFTSFVRKTHKQLEERVHVVLDETNILSERHEHEDEAIGLVKGLNEIIAQADAAPEERTGDETGSSIQGNLIGGTEQRITESNSSMEHVYDLVLEQQNIRETSSGNQMVVKPYKYQSSHPIENIINDPTFGIKTRSSLKNFCVFDAFLSLIEPKNVAEALQDADWVNAINKLDEDGTIIRNKARLVVQMDVKSAFLNGYLKEEVFINQQLGFKIKECQDHVHKLDKALCGLKQAPEHGMEDYPNFCLNMATREIDSTLFLKEKGLCARFQANPKESHLIVVKRILSYLKGANDICIWYPKRSNFNLVGYADADYAVFLVDRKITSGMAHFLGSCLVSWATKKQNSVVLSTAEDEHVAIASCCAQLMWIK